jgi:hypothetical protein
MKIYFKLQDHKYIPSRIEIDFVRSRINHKGIKHLE